MIIAAYFPNCKKLKHHRNPHGNVRVSLSQTVGLYEEILDIKIAKIKNSIIVLATLGNSAIIALLKLSEIFNLLFL